MQKYFKFGLFYIHARTSHRFRPFLRLRNQNKHFSFQVIKWLEQHKDDPVVEETDETIERRSEEIPEWDSQFIGVSTLKTVW